MQFRVALPFALVFFLPLLTTACGRGSSGDAPAGRPDLVLVTIDTLRADRVGRGVMPRLDALAAQGLHFTHARATAPLTLPSHVSMLTGALPPEHGVRENGVHVARGNPVSVARRLQDGGYRTAGFIGAYVLDRRFGIADGFEHYDDQIARDPAAVQRLEAERPANVVVDRALAWLHATDRTKPVFIWAHFYDPHAPYHGSYDTDVAFADAQLGRLLDGIAASARRPIVIVAGDHGESLGEHGEATHGMLVYEAAIRVPLAVAGPGIRAVRRDDPVSLVDIAPTLAALGGTKLDGSSAAQLLLAPPPAEREIYAESRYPRVAGWSPVHTLIFGRWKLILSRDPELYDLSADPAEEHDVAGSRAAVVESLAARLESWRATTAAADAAPRADAAEKLRALGYVAGGRDRPTARDAPNPADHIAAWREFEAALAEPGSRAAVRRLEQLAAAYPAAPVFQSTYARTLAESGSSEAALAVYRRAVAQWPDDGTLFHELAVAARSAGRRDEAMKAEQAAIAVDPALPAAHNGIGLLLADAERHADAAAAFERAARLDPTNAEYWVNLGNAHRAAGRPDAAAMAYERAAETDPHSADAANGLGVLLVQAHRPAAAVPLFERALAKAPDFHEARLNLAIAYHESGDRERAAELYREILTRAKPGSPERRAAADLLRSIGR